MIYYRARADLQFMQEFRQDVIHLWKLEDQAAGSLAAESPAYQEVRERISRNLVRAWRIGQQLGTIKTITAYPPPYLAGSLPVIQVNAFECILHDPTYEGVPRQMICDALNQTIGACEEQAAQERRQLLNPVYWLNELLKFIVQIPYRVLQASGFDVEKIQEHLWARLFQLLLLVAVLLVAVYALGLTTKEVVELVKVLLK